MKRIRLTLFLSRIREQNSVDWSHNKERRRCLREVGDQLATTHLCRRPVMSLSTCWRYSKPLILDEDMRSNLRRTIVTDGALITATEGEGFLVTVFYAN